MIQLVNQNSFLLFAVPVVLALLYLLLRPPGSTVKQLLALLLLAATVLGFFLTRPGGHASSGAEAEALLFQPGRPTLLEIYSPY